MDAWFPRPAQRDDTYARRDEPTLSWLRRSTLPLAADCRAFLNRNLDALPVGCRKGIFEHLSHRQHAKDGFFELIVARTLQELGADIVCEPVNPVDGTRVDFLADFPDAAVSVEATAPVLDRELSAIAVREGPVEKLIEESVPSGWAAIIRRVPSVKPDESRRHIKAFLRREMDLPPPTDDAEEVEVRGSFEEGDLHVVLLPQARHGLSPHTKVAIGNAIAYFPDDETPLRAAVRKKYRQLRNVEGTTLVALNMSSTTASREDLDQALFGMTVSVLDASMNETRRYFRHDGLFAAGEGEPTISGVLAFPTVGYKRCDDPILWVHPRYTNAFPQALQDLERRFAPDAGPVIRVEPARRTDVLKGLGFGGAT